MPEYEIRDAAGKKVRTETTEHASLAPTMIDGETAHPVGEATAELEKTARPDATAKVPAKPPTKAAKRR